MRETAATPAAPEGTAPAAQLVETHVTRRVPPGFNDAAAAVEGQLHELAQAGSPNEVFGAPPPDVEVDGVTEDQPVGDEVGTGDDQVLRHPRPR